MSSASGRMNTRPYRSEDARATCEIFERAVHETAAAHYRPEQLDAWAPPGLDDAALAEWGARRAAAQTLVAVEGEEIAGFSDLAGETLLDMLFVDPRFGRRGVGSMLISSIIRLARAAGAPYLETHASLTARALFERHGFVVVAQQTPVIRGVALRNFRMRLRLDERSVGLAASPSLRDRGLPPGL